MDTNCNAWARTPANGHAVVAGVGFKAKMPSLNWSKQEAFVDDSRDHIIMTRTLCSKKCLIVYAVEKCVFKNFVRHVGLHFILLNIFHHDLLFSVL